VFHLPIALAALTLGVIAFHVAFPETFLSAALLTFQTVALSVAGFLALRRKAGLLISLPLLFVGLGDLSYGIAVDALHLDFPNKIGCLIYVIPYLLGMGLFLKFNLKRVLNSKDQALQGVVLVLSLGAGAISAIAVMIPALFHKFPELPAYLKWLTVVFTLLESSVIGVSASLLMVSSSLPIQMILFGVLFMHVSDIAVRYQSVDTSMLGINAFSYGWIVGLLLIAVGSGSIRDFELEKRKIVPFKSVRGVLVAGFLLSLTVSALVFNLFQSGVVPERLIAGRFSVIMMVVSVFYFGMVLLSNALLFQFQRIVEAGGGSETESMPLYEVKRIQDQILKSTAILKGELETTRGKAERLAHDIRSPISALKMASSALASMAQAPTVSSEDLKPIREIMDNVNQAVGDISKEILMDRRERQFDETLEKSIQGAVMMAKNSNPRARFEIDSVEGLPELRLPGLTRVLVNLLNNSAAAPEGGFGTIKIEARANSEEVILRVLDQAGGIPETILARLRNRESLTTKQGGNGIGLASAMEWAEGRGLRFSIQSSTDRRDHGTLIELRIPR
jgi:signal transduction histidine kinase